MSLARAHVKKDDFESVFALWSNTVGLASFTWSPPMPDGSRVFAFESKHMTEQRFAHSQPGVTPLPAASSPKPIGPDVAALFPHVKAHQAMTAYDLYDALHGAHGKHPVLDPEG